MKSRSLEIALLLASMFLLLTLGGCNSHGDVLAEVQKEASGKENVLKALDACDSTNAGIWLKMSRYHTNNAMRIVRKG